MVSVSIRFLGFIIVAVACAISVLRLTSEPSLSSAYHAMNVSSEENYDSDAARIWEEAIAAKGGRERLYTVENILISSRFNHITSKGKKIVARRETLSVFPNKSWSYEDYGSDVFGITVLMFNYENMTMYFGVPGRPETRIYPLKETTRDKRADNVAISLLLETKWLKPVLLMAKTDTIDSAKVDVVEAEINGRRVDFAFDQKTHLPVQVSFYNIERDKTTWVNVQRFSDYMEVSGIKVPQTLMYSEGSPEKAVIQFNVDYNLEIFVKPPTKADPQAWKLRAKEK